ncbi:MAG: HEAT repeat domain-containing protein, partial [Sedimentisphaerales bacterium]|nr:HEAT repeat domain-containing protein [Sedimentisphaerales bacterium]
PAAVEQLQQSRRQIRGQENEAVAAAVAEGLLACAESLHKAGATSQAREVYASLYESPQSPLIQLGSLRGLATTAPSAQQRDEWILSALDAQEAIVQAGAIAMVGDLETTEAIEQAAGQMQSMSNQNKVRMLAALTQHRADRMTPAVMQALVQTSGDEDETVRVAALEALGVLGGKGQVELLARRAAETQDAEAAAARDALAQIDGDAASDEVLRLLATLQGQAKVELVTAIGSRNITGAVRELLQAARAENPAVRKEAYKVLRQIAGPEHVAALVELVVSPADPADRGQAQNTVVTAAQKASSTDDATAPVLAAWQRAQDPEVRAALLRVLADLPTSASLGALRQGLQDATAAVREAALRGLAAWPTAEPTADLATVAEQATDSKDKILAFRGFVRMIPLSNSSASQQVALYRQAAALAPNANERKGVLAGLATMESVEALEMAAEYLDEAALQEEAAVAVISIAEHTAKDAPEATRKALRRAVDLVRNDQAKQAGLKILEQLG